MYSLGYKGNVFTALMPQTLEMLMTLPLVLIKCGADAEVIKRTDRTLAFICLS